MIGKNILMFKTLYKKNGSDEVKKHLPITGVIIDKIIQEGSTMYLIQMASGLVATIAPHEIASVVSEEEIETEKKEKEKKIQFDYTIRSDSGL